MLLAEKLKKWVKLVILQHMQGLQNVTGYYTEMKAVEVSCDRVVQDIVMECVEVVIDMLSSAQKKCYGK